MGPQQKIAVIVESSPWETAAAVVGVLVGLVALFEAGRRWRRRRGD